MLILDIESTEPKLTFLSKVLSFFLLIPVGKKELAKIHIEPMWTSPIVDHALTSTRFLDS